MSEYELDLSYYENKPPRPITHEMFNKLIKQRDQYKAERDTLEAQKIAFARSYKQVVEENKKLKHENKALRLQADTYFDEWQEAERCIKKLEEEIKKLKGED